jgi:hypothetical protein
MVLIGAIVVIVLMIGLCYFTSGISITAGSIFEKKTTIVKGAKK